MRDQSNEYRVLVTGSCGFVGRYLVPALAAALPDDAEILAGSHERGNEFLSGKVRTLSFDVTSPEQVHQVIASSQPTHVFHLAGIAAVRTAQQDVRQTWNVNFGGTLNVALAISEAAPEARLIQCSSALIYGSSAGATPIDEHAPLNPDNAYGASKAAADIMVGQMAKQGLRAVRLRPFNHAGPGQSGNFVVPDFAAQIVRIERGQQNPVMHVGGLDNLRDFLDVRDVVQAYIKTVLCFDNLPNGCVINIASGNPWSIRAILNTLLVHSRQKIEIVEDSELTRNSGSSVMVGSPETARILLDWSPSIEFSSTLAAVLEYLRRA